MTILFIFHTAILDGGASKSGLNLVMGLKGKGVEVHTIVPSEGPLKDELTQKGFSVDVVPFKWAYPRYFGNIKSIVKFVPRLIGGYFINNHAVKNIEAVAKKYFVDIIHSNSSVIDVGFKAATNLKIPHITHNREFGYKDCTAVMWHIDNQLSKPDSFSISITKCIKSFRHLDNCYHHRVIYNGMYPASSAIFKEKKEPYFLYVGALNRQKGLLDLIEGYGIFSKANKNAPPLKIAGDTRRFDPALKNETNAICQKYGIFDKIEWLGKRKDITDLMSKALCLIVPSFNEAFGRVMAEAMFNGCLVIGRNNAGLKEQFDNGIAHIGEEIGFRFLSVDELAKQMEKVISKPIQLFYPIILNAQKCAIDLYSNETYVEKTIHFYNEILHKSDII